MRCANPACHVLANELLKGTLRLVEFETAPDDRLLYSTGGFPVCTARTKYFWLCQACSRRFTIRSWNSSGVVLDPLPESYPLPISTLERKPASQDRPDSTTRPGVLYKTA
jgi:hypothetical protein